MFKEENETNPLFAAEAEAEGKGGTPKGGESQEGHLTLPINEVVSDVYFCRISEEMIHFDEYFSDGLVQPPTSQIEREMATCSDPSTIFCLNSGGYTDRKSSQNNVFLIFVTLNWWVTYSKLIGLGGWWSFTVVLKLRKNRSNCKLKNARVWNAFNWNGLHQPIISHFC